MAQLELNGVVQRYGKQTIVDGVNFQLEAGSIACLLGPSGCGKTTLLRCIAGFEEIADGEIRLRQEAVSRAGQCVPPEKRRIGMVFQDYALFPHLTVEQNVAFGLGRKPAEDAHLRVRQLLATVGLHGQGDKYPHELSGGQQQRVALARALAPRPELILLDEPFSNLDVGLRERLSVEVREILKRETEDQINTAMQALSLRLRGAQNSCEATMGTAICAHTLDALPSTVQAPLLEATLDNRYLNANRASMLGLPGLLR